MVGEGVIDRATPLVSTIHAPLLVTLPPMVALTAVIFVALNVVTLGAPGMAVLLLSSLGLVQPVTAIRAKTKKVIARRLRLLFMVIRLKSLMLLECFKCCKIYY